MSLAEGGRALAEIVTGLQAANVPYFVGGSMASVVHGELRTTHDVDIVVDLRPEHVSELVATLALRFLVDAEFVRYAIRHRSSCNLIHRATGFKVDLFLCRDRAFSRMEMQRCQTVELMPGVPMRVASAEDCVLSKLEWFEKGGRVSDRQWRDILGILKAQQGSLDTAYLSRWARELAVDNLLEQALRQTGRTA